MECAAAFLAMAVYATKRWSNPTTTHYEVDMNTLDRRGKRVVRYALSNLRMCQGYRTGGQGSVVWAEKVK